MKLPDAQYWSIGAVDEALPAHEKLSDNLSDTTVQMSDKRQTHSGSFVPK